MRPLALLLLLCSVTAGLAEASVPDWLRAKYNAYSIFSDTSADHPAYEATVDLYRQRIISGQGNTGTMTLEAPITRAEVAKILSHALELRLLAVLPSPSFPDLDPTQWYFPYAETLLRMGVFKGYTDGTFRPAGEITYGEILKLLAVGFGHSDPKAPDSTPWPQRYYDALMAQGVIPPSLALRDFSTPVTRAEVFTLLSRTLRVQDEAAPHYREQIQLTVDGTSIQAIPATPTLLTDPSVWLDDLTNTGLGYYYDRENENFIVFGHSSTWEGDPTPYGPVLSPLLQRDITRGDTLTLTVDGQPRHYVIIEKTAISQRDAEALRDSSPETDALLFTCNTDLSERILVRAQQME
ncbi:sortase [Candidatus Peribacteria bacterium]|nr:sortase [Candidatus Peribacteria bacterium]